MKPIDYIYENIDCFNLTIFKQILEESGETVSEEIYDYLMETTWNTNPALLKQYGLDIERSNEEENKNIFLSLVASGGSGGDEEEGIYCSIWTNTLDEGTIEKINSLVSGNNITVLIDDTEWFTTTIQVIDSIITFGPTQGAIISGQSASNPYELPEFFSINSNIKIILNN